MQIEIRRFAFAIVTLLSAGLLFAQTPAQKSFTLEQVLELPFPAGLTTASHSSRIAWVFNAKGVPNVWIADAPKFDAKQVTHYNADEGLPLPPYGLPPTAKPLSSRAAQKPTVQARLPTPLAMSRSARNRFGL